jgi:hypothetical protein
MEVLPDDFIFMWIFSQLFINFIFMFEFLSDIFIGGYLTTVFDKGRTRVEFVCQFINIIAIIKLILYDAETDVNHYLAV